MRLTPKEQEKLLLHMAGELAAKRRSRGLLLNYTEAKAYLSAELLELARDGKTVVELMEQGRRLLTTEDVMEGVADMIQDVQVEAAFLDGTKLVTVHNPIQPGVSRWKGSEEKPVQAGSTKEMRPGEILPLDRDIILNDGRESKKLMVSNVGDRPIQVGSHFHFFEVNKLLKFERGEAFGYHLDIASGTSVRFEPGETKEVQLVEFGGKNLVYGLNDLTRGEAIPENLVCAMELAEKKGML